MVHLIELPIISFRKRTFPILLIHLHTMWIKTKLKA